MGGGEGFAFRKKGTCPEGPIEKEKARKRTEEIQKKRNKKSPYSRSSTILSIERGKKKGGERGTNISLPDRPKHRGSESGDGPAW